MPRSPRSQLLTSFYRDRLQVITRRVEATAAREWPTIDGLDGTGWPARMATVVAGAQTEAARVSAAYLTAFITSELGRRVPTISVDSTVYSGLSRDGRPLQESLRSPIIGVLAALTDGKGPEEALAFGRNRGVRMVEVDLMHAARRSLIDAIEADDRLGGFQRVTAGTCNACLALSAHHGPHFSVHPHCRCIPQPRVKGVPDTHPVPTAQQLFDRLTERERITRFGREKALALAAGAIAFTDLVDESHLATGEDDFITETPLSEAA